MKFVLWSGLALCLFACGQDEADEPLMPGAEPEAMEGEPVAPEPAMDEPGQPDPLPDMPEPAPNEPEPEQTPGGPDWHNDLPGPEECADLPVFDQAGVQQTFTLRPDLCDASGCTSAGDDRFLYVFAPRSGFFRLTISGDGRMLPRSSCQDDAPLTTGGYVNPLRVIERWLEASEVYPLGVGGILDDPDNLGAPNGTVTFTFRLDMIDDVDTPHDLPSCADWAPVPDVEAGVWQADGSVLQAQCDYGCGGGTVDTHRFVAPETGTYQINVDGPRFQVLDGCDAAYPRSAAFEDGMIRLRAGQLIAIRVFDDVSIDEQPVDVPYTLRIEQQN